MTGGEIIVAGGTLQQTSYRPSGQGMEMPGTAITLNSGTTFDNTTWDAPVVFGSLAGAGTANTNDPQWRFEQAARRRKEQTED